ncbi:uncharacterized protein LOC130442826 [Diorhabda sublineata]|uniref:uncharacterized protein LOC130442826 n=1 Tax=Diorhabda sublineata TaxID=1163346 RepID=UPI0024E0C1B0|nr:uncharacterized protein LOC130442826 [Diorhabda sublineata]
MDQQSMTLLHSSGPIQPPSSNAPPHPRRLNRKGHGPLHGNLQTERLSLSEEAKLLYSQEMSSMPSKTPVSVLQELLSRRGITPKYELVQIEGAIHEPIFRYRVFLNNDLVATGTGRSKKDAKHAAAKNLLDLLVGKVTPEQANQTNGTPGAVDITNQVVSPFDDKVMGNPIGWLQEMCMSRRWPPPSYEMEHEEGLPHERQFTIACQVLKFREVGTGKSKKLAKRMAAHKMWQALQDLPLDGNNLPSVFGSCEDFVNKLGSVQNRYSGLKDTKITKLSNQQSLKVAHFHKTLKNAVGQKLAELQTVAISSKDFNFVQFLQEIAAEQSFEVTYVDIEEKSLAGCHQCLVQISTLPVAVCYGTGKTPKEAKASAAHHALEYLKIMTKKQNSLYFPMVLIKIFGTLFKWTMGVKHLSSSSKQYNSNSTGMKVTIVGGAGNIGQPLCLLLKQSPLLDELCIHDMVPTAGLAGELNHVDTNCKVVAYTGKECYQQALQNSKLVVVLASAPNSDQNPEKMWSANAKIVQEIVTNVGKYANKAFLAIGTNPINSLVPMACEILKKHGCYNPNTIFGITTLDTVRANTFAARALGLEPECVLVPVIGGHTEETVVPVLSNTKPTPEYTPEEIENITMHVKKANDHLMKMKPGENGALASAFACARFIISLVKAMKGYPDIIECAYVASKIHPDAKYLSTPLLLGTGGISKNLGVPNLTEFESCNLDNAIMHLKNDIKQGESFVGVNDNIECDPCNIQVPRCPRNWCEYKKGQKNM